MKTLTIVAVLLFAGFFYWFQWRPTEIRKTCSLEANDRAHEWLSIQADLTQNENLKQTYLDAYEKGLINTNAKDSYYENCLHNKGL